MMVGGCSCLLCPECTEDQTMLRMLVMLVGTCQSLRAGLSLPSSLSLFFVVFFFSVVLALHFTERVDPIH